MTALDQLKTSVMNDKENQEKYNMERDRYQLMKYLKELRKVKGITQKELAQKMGYSQQGIIQARNITTVIQHWTYF